MGKWARNLGRALSALVVTLVLGASLIAQSGDGTVIGQVTDQSEAVIPAINVTLMAPGGATRTTQTDEKGHYAFHKLAPGDYTVRIDVKGFAPFQKTGVSVAAGRTETVNAQLQVALETQRVNVEAEANRVSVSSSSNISAVVLKGKDLEALSDDPDELQDELTALAGPAAGPNGGQIYIDGFSGGQLPPKSEILEIRINQNPFSAQYDRLGYGRIEITTKPGSQQFHGQVFSFGNASVLNSRNPFVAQQPSYHSMFYSGNLGGPITKKAAFFFNVFRRDINDNSIVTATVLDSNFNPVAYNAAITNPRTFTHLNPRVDFQLSDRNVLSIRTEFSWDSTENGGIGQFSLPSQAFNSTGHGFELHATDTQVVSARTVNQLRFGFERDVTDTTSTSLDPSVSVLQTFTDGGNSRGIANVATDDYEINNMTSMSLGKHSVSFGGRLRGVTVSNYSTSGYNGSFTFASLAAYQVIEQGLAQNQQVPDIINNCLAAQQAQNPPVTNLALCGPSQFSITSGNSLAAVNMWDVGVYGEDEWRIRPNISLTAGLRFEGQTQISDHADFAPRIGLAWGIGKGARPQTVLRAGFGIFYDRFEEGNILQAERLNGINQQRYVDPYPNFFAETKDQLPPLATIIASSQAVAPTIYQIDPTLRSPYTIQSAIGLERQFGKSVTASATYINSHGVHQLLTRNINAPLPGTYNPDDPKSGTRPFGNIGNIYQYETDGLFNESQLISNFSIRNGTRLSLNGFYTLSYANSNAVGGGFPSNQYDLHADYGPAPFVIRHQAFLGGSVALIKGFRLSPFMVINSGRPYSITSGQDNNGDSIFNDRPAYAAAGATGQYIVSNSYGSFNLRPMPGDVIVPPNYLFGPSQFSMNARLAKTFGFGKVRGNAGGGPNGMWRGGRGGPGGRGGGLGPQGLSGGGGGGFWGGPSSAENHRYQLELSLMAQNAFNKVNLAPPIGNLSSRYFGQSISLASGFFGGRGGSGGQSASNRSLNLMLRFSF